MRISRPVLALFAVVAVFISAADRPVSAQGSLVDYDTDDDGLIEISYLEQLDAIRHDLDGNGRADSGSSDTYASAFPNASPDMGCPSGGCIGYELVRDLDFRDPGSYASGEVAKGWTASTSSDGWVPIGGEGSEFEATLDGNHHSIANLFIFIEEHSWQDIGLFGKTGSRGHIRRAGLIDVAVEGRISTSDVGPSPGYKPSVAGLVARNTGTIYSSYVTGSVLGHGAPTGGLVGLNRGAITFSYAKTNVTAKESIFFVSPQDAGGLVGENHGTITSSYATGKISGGATIGGLAGSNYGTIVESYAAGGVIGTGDVGGLVGGNLGRITTSYAIGSVTGTGSVGGLVGTNGGRISSSYATGVATGLRDVGGLVGLNRGSGAIDASYATGAASGNDRVGGLAGSNIGIDAIAESYWDTETSGLRDGVGKGFPSASAGKTTAELQAPTDYTGLYGNWNVDVDNADGDNHAATGVDDPWDFGTDSQYPALKVDFDGDGAATWQEFGNQRAVLLPATGGVSLPASIVLALGLVGSLLVMAGSTALGAQRHRQY